jgi:UDP-N-acetylmuramate dehydrogenase
MAELRHYTSLRVGGPAKKFVDAHNEKEIVAAIEAAGDTPILIIGGGTNILVADNGFDGTVIRITNKSLEAEIDACSGATLSIGAGENWDDFVKSTVGRGFAGLETLSGIPGSVGASPIQNIGAYGHEVSETIARVRAFDRKKSEVVTFTNQMCNFSYRNSIFKEESGRYVVLSVTFQLRKGEESLPIAYAELAKYLSVNIGDRVNVKAVRNAVLDLRGRKGMLLDSKENQIHSAGSFFINPILSKEAADKLPIDAPRWPQADGKVKTSAAWLMEHSGITKGEKLAGAQISSKHVLALSNSGSATADDIIELAKMARAKVNEKFGIKLQAEVQLIGVDLN